jgi:CIC family chloride channel protein
LRLVSQEPAHAGAVTPYSLNPEQIPSTLRTPGALSFWLAIVLTGVCTGLGAAALTEFLYAVQRFVWHSPGIDLLPAVLRTPGYERVLILSGAGVVTACGQLLLKRLSNANGIDVTAAIWFYAGRLPGLRTLGSAVLSVIIVAMGVSLGREGAPKQAGAVFANFFSDRAGLSDEQRRLLVACGAGAGMSAAYGVPIGGALFGLEDLRGVLALRFVLPAILMSSIATGVAWIFLPNTAVYSIPAFSSEPSVLVWTLFAGPIAGLLSVAYVRAITKAERIRPEGWKRLLAPIVVMTLLGLAAIWFPQVLGNGKDLAQLAFSGSFPPGFLLALLFLKPLATVLCLGSGAPGGLFTPSLSIGSALGGFLGWMWSFLWPGGPPGLFALLGAGAVLAATTQGPISTVVLLIEMTGRDRSFVLPLLLVVGIATLTARSVDSRSVYDARLSDEEIEKLHRFRDLKAPSA